MREGRTRAPYCRRRGPSSRETSLIPESPRASGRFSLFGRWKHRVNLQKAAPPPPAEAPADPPPPPAAPAVAAPAVLAQDTRSLDTSAAQPSLASNAAPALGANATGIDGVPLVHSQGETPSRAFVFMGTTYTPLRSWNWSPRSLHVQEMRL